MRENCSPVGEQAVQSIIPLKVVITGAGRENARQLGITVEQLLEIEEFPPTDPKELEWAYVPRNPLVSPEDEKLLSTQMYRLHDWYMREVKSGRQSLMVSIKREHYYHEKHLWVEFPELFQLFNQDALDKSLVSCYCL